MTKEAKELGEQPAFPSEQTAYEPGHVFSARDKILSSGCTKRELFTALAMQSLIVSQQSEMAVPYLPGFDGSEAKFDKWLAHRAQEITNQQLEQLSKQS